MFNLLIRIVSILLPCALLVSCSLKKDEDIRKNPVIESKSIVKSPNIKVTELEKKKQYKEKFDLTFEDFKFLKKGMEYQYIIEKIGLPHQYIGNNNPNYLYYLKDGSAIELIYVKDKLTGAFLDPIGKEPIRNLLNDQINDN